MLEYRGPLGVLVVFLIASYTLSDLPVKMWNFILAHEWSRSALIYPITTSIETLVFYIVFYIIDRFAFHKRLSGPIKAEVNTQTYIEAMKLAAKNILYLTLFLVAITYAITGDIHGGYCIQGIHPSQFPQIPPSFNRFIFELFVVVMCTDFCLYWLHRTHHLLPLYRRFHKVHHAFPEPVAAHATSIHIVELFSVAPFIFIVPRILYELFGLHPLSVYFSPHLVAFHGVLEHCGYDDYLEYLSFGLITGSKMHFVHHQIPRANFGFYTYFWDWVFGTKLSYDDMVNNSKLRADKSQEKTINP